MAIRGEQSKHQKETGTGTLNTSSLQQAQKPLSPPGEASTSGQVSKPTLELRLEVPEEKVYDF